MRARTNRTKTARAASWTLAALATTCLAASSTTSDDDAKPADPKGAPTLDETRLVLGKWIETQKIIAKERDDWQQGKEILASRLELVQKEIAALEQKIDEAKAAVDKTNAKKAELIVDDANLVASGERLADAATSMEGGLRRLQPMLPTPSKEKVEPLYARMPQDPSSTKVSVAERFQNVLGILNELDKDANDVAVAYEVHELADGKPSEVRVLYVGLAQAYWVSAGGEAGVGKPAPASGSDPGGWKWEPSRAIANDVLTALDVLQGKHTPAFVPLPVTLR